jgi:crossover junction endodeoxyribonuclease RusA
MKLVLPLPPSANRYYRNVRGRTLLSKEAREYREACAMAAAAQWRGKPITSPVRIEAHVYMTLRGDLMNREKQLLDALEGTAIVDDSQVWDMRMVRHIDRKNPRVEITITAIEQEAA